MLRSRIALPYIMSLLHFLELFDEVEMQIRPSK